MNRRMILAILSGGAAGLYSRLAPAATNDSRSPAVSAPEATGKVVRAPSGFRDLKSASLDQQVQSIAHMRGAYRVATADGAVAYFLEPDLRFKIDSSDLGPRRGRPVMLPAGTAGDRAWIFFSSPKEIAEFIGTESS